MSKCKYYKLIKQVSYDGGQTWTDVVPEVSEKGDLIEPDSPDCQEGVQYRWYTSPSEYLCSATTKYEKQYYQVSTDSGQTWENVSPEQTRMGSVIETQSTDCGYIPPTGNYLAILTLSNGSTVNIEDDGTHILSESMTSGYTNSSVVRSVEILTACTTVGKAAFLQCSGMTSLTIPNTVTRIRENAFSHCTSLTSLTIPNSVTSIEESAFMVCKSLTSVTIPSSITTLSPYVFAYCSGLTRVNIPNSVTSIEDYAFGHCSGLTEVTIPSGVTSMSGGVTFMQCTGLRQATCLATTPPSVEYYPFGNCSNLQVIYVPSASVSAYKSAAGWRVRADLIQAIL